MRLISRPDSYLTLDNILACKEDILKSDGIYLDLSDRNKRLGPSVKNKYFLITFGMLFALLHYSSAISSHKKSVTSFGIQTTNEKSYYNVAYDITNNSITQLEPYIISPKSAFLISPVRISTIDIDRFMLKYRQDLLDSQQFKEAYYPRTDTDQTTGHPLVIGTRICKDNLKNMSKSGTTKYYFSEESSGSIFDLGMYTMLKFHLDSKIHPGIERRLELINPGDIDRSSYYGNLLYQLSRLTV